jgi:hypothetical protein
MTLPRATLDALNIVRELRENGALCLPSFFCPSLAENMRKEATCLLSAQIDGVKAIQPHPSGRMVWIYPKILEAPLFPCLNQALRLPLFQEIAERYDGKCKFLHNAIITHDYRPCTITDVHFDADRSLKFMIYLSDVDKDSAAFRYCLGSHRLNRKLRHRFLMLGGRIEDIPNIPGPSEELQLTDMEGPAGTLIVFDTDGFHSAGALKEGRERVLIRSRTLLSAWFDNRILRQATKLNPLRFLRPFVIPEGRRATRGSTRALNDLASKLPPDGQL